MPASMDSPSPKRLRSDPEAESADKITMEDFQLNMLADRAKAESADEDRISSLPEDVIGYILSLLTLREAQATCLLSKRWRQLSTRHVTNLDYLDFDWSDLLRGMKANPEIAEKERARYVEWVDNVVHRQSGRDHTLHRFMICFDLNFSCKSHIDRWIKFALAKRVKVLHLNFEPVYKEDLIDGCLPYPLGHETIMDADVGCLQQSSDLRKVGLSPSIPWHVGFRYLEELHLKRVIVDGKLIEQLLANSPVLERLTLDDARTLNRLRVAGQSLKLKYLCVACCFDLECIEICDMDLVSFTFVGLYSLLSMDKLPQLHEVSLSGCISIVRNYLPQLSSLPCLQILELEFDYSHPAHLAIPSHLPKLTSVKQLKLRVGGSGDISLLPLTIVIKACPYLRSFVFELTNPWWKPNEKGRELERVVGPVHQYLKEVEFYNYYGRPCDYELVNYLVENAIALEKLMVNPCDLALEPYDKGYFSGRMIKVKEPRERAVQQLKGKLPSKIELVIT